MNVRVLAGANGFMLGTFSFAVSGIFPASISQESNYVWDTANGLPKWIGEGEDKITISGAVFYTRKLHMDAGHRMRLLAAKKKPLTLIKDTPTGGLNLGDWCLLSVSEDVENFVMGSPIKASYTLVLVRYMDIAKIETESGGASYSSSSSSPQASVFSGGSSGVSSSNASDWLYGDSGQSSNVSDESAMAWLLSQY